MKWQEIQVTVHRDGVEAVANILHETGANGVIIEDPQLKWQYIEEKRWDYYEFPEEEAGDPDLVVVKAYLPEGTKLAAQVEDVKRAVNDLKHYHLPGLYCELAFSLVDDQDWATSWKKYFKTEKIGEKIVIKPTWEDYQAQDGEIVVELDPGMAFGTGTHPTTAMCIRALEKLFPGPRVVYDVGTGSGVLAIVAAKLGAEDVLAIDLDETAVKVAWENADQNDVTHIVRVEEGNLLDTVAEPADLIIANIIADIIIMVTPAVKEHLLPGGRFLCSGIIEEREQEVRAALEVSGLTIVETWRDSGWVAMLAERR
ncbi:MAG: 50S ribosomal protein L11 methyltransferase [Bacillota bacterium]|uniref:Ribosomal protein L11 methyltransferase n=2 Tax=Carboxydocella TaxID=178898 RepID=A0A1T4NEF7_9FIRM|nr:MULTISPECIES: 50S ribosomal protein L11 methyltransferase [Carboxydocella]AVX20008.1 [LSU ribosomal protein L11P]-lysine N-methyltransferase [Carboxydocella thermautotrophica]AVX30424.1 [LSU ribosomal protein L11P]-lysine N-methyltransferase [Carboxydocella thermautotrophica]SJZ77649.1 ribosomal protein L11 methyltransferase [Carboxydocella sporoproducens DSM 16521]GAW30204.1 ribosomal protein L11 methyltransferase [Carboxydocella sp. ULO1]GAW32338.1 ribosomal protein L11 methyltransferase 